MSSQVQKAEVQTLVYFLRRGKVLLIEKKRGLGKGFFNGVGGKVHKNESVEQAALRECEEEICALPKKLHWQGLLEFINYKKREIEMIYVHVFLCKKWKGKVKETEEAKPFWFKLSEIPWDKMWEDDKFWLPYVLRGKKIFASFKFNRWKLINGNVMVLENGRKIKTRN